MNEKVGPFIVAPCEHEMASHLRFNSGNGFVEHRTLEGKYTEDLLQLNDDATVQYRLGTLRTAKMYSAEIDEQERQLTMVARLLHEGRISQQQFDAEALSIHQELEQLHHTLQSYTGDLALPPLPNQRLGLPMSAPS